ncbi:MAG: aldolase [Deltaproteobacteria bacterium]|nr:aldolase [Deltaproteobacteria bacterium]
MSYSIGDYQFDVEEFFPYNIFSAITDIRVKSPEIIEKEAQVRKRREKLGGNDGKLTILAADHPARHITKSGDAPLIMGNRHSYLGRLLRVVTNPEFDGIMGTPDIIEDLLIVNHLVKEAGSEGFLDNKVILGCMNRGGLSGVIFEMDDTFTAFTAESIHALRLDGAKIMFRLEVNSPESGRTIKYCADAVTECNDYGIHAFVEPLAVEKTEEGYKIKKVADDLIKVVGVASALGATSARTWLKIPYCENYELVAKATSLPCLMLGGASKDDPTPTIEEFAKGIRAGASIRGALVGRNVHHPANGDDPLAIALAINGIVHSAFTAEESVDHLMEQRGKNMDVLTKYLG